MPCTNTREANSNSLQLKNLDTVSPYVQTVAVRHDAVGVCVEGSDTCNLET